MFRVINLNLIENDRHLIIMHSQVTATAHNAQSSVGAERDLWQVAKARQSDHSGNSSPAPLTVPV